MFLTRDTLDINSLVDFVAETKPYHTKLKEILVEYQWDDVLHANVGDRSQIFTELTSAWGGLGWKYQNRRHIFNRYMPRGAEILVGDAWIQPIRNLKNYSFMDTSNACTMNKIQQLYMTLGFDVPAIDETGLGAGFSNEAGNSGTAGYDVANLDRYGLESAGISEDDSIEVSAEKWLPKIGVIRNYAGKKRVTTSLDAFYTTKSVTITTDYLISDTVDFNITLINRHNLQTLDQSQYTLVINVSPSTTTDNYTFDFEFVEPFNGIIHIDYPNWVFEDYCMISEQAPKWLTNEHIVAYDLKWYDTYHDRLRVYTDNNICGIHRMNGQADGSAKYRQWRLPATMFPRYSDNERSIDFVGVTDESANVVRPVQADAFMVYDPTLIELSGSVATYKAVFNFRYRFDNSVHMESIDKIFFGIPQSHQGAEFTYVRTRTNLDDLQPLAAKEWVVGHNLGSSYVEIRVYNNLNQRVYPINIVHRDINTTVLTFEYPQYAGRAVVQKYGEYPLKASNDWHVFFDDSPSIEKVVRHGLNTQCLAVSLQDKSGKEISDRVTFTALNSNAVQLHSDAPFVGKLVFKLPDVTYTGLNTTSGKKLTIQHGLQTEVLPFVWKNGQLITFKRIKNDGQKLELWFNEVHHDLSVGLVTGAARADFTGQKIVQIPHGGYSYDLFSLAVDASGYVLTGSRHIDDARTFTTTLENSNSGSVFYAIDSTGTDGEYTRIDGFEKFDHDIMINDVEMVFTYDAVGDKLSYPFFYTKYLEYIEARHNGMLSPAELTFADFIESKRYLGFNHGFFISYGNPDKIYDAITSSLHNYLNSDVGVTRDYAGDISSIEANVLNLIAPMWQPGINYALEQTIVAITNTHLYNGDGAQLTDKSALISYLTYTIGIIANMQVGDATAAFNNAIVYLRNNLNVDSFKLIAPGMVLAEYLQARINLLPAVYNELAHIKYVEWDRVNQRILALQGSSPNPMLSFLNNDIQQKFTAIDINNTFVAKFKESITSILNYSEVITQCISEIVDNVYPNIVDASIARMISSGGMVELTQVLGVLTQAHLVGYSNSFISNLKVAELGVKFSKIFENDLTFSLINRIAGQYLVPWNNGAHVYVNGVLQKLGDDYYFADAASGRSRLQFVDGKFPQQGDNVHVNLLLADRIYVSYVKPSDPEHPYNCGNGEKWIDFLAVKSDLGFDSSGYDLMPYDSYWDLANSAPNYNEAFTINTLNFGSANANTKLPSIGTVKFLRENGESHYELAFDEDPEAGTIIRIRVEQATQLNSITRTCITEQFRVNDSVRLHDAMAVGLTDHVHGSKDFTRFDDFVGAQATETYDRLKNVVDTGDFQGFDRQGFGSLAYDNGTYGSSVFNSVFYEAEFLAAVVENRPATGFVIKMSQADRLNVSVIESVSNYEPVWLNDMVSVDIGFMEIPKILIPMIFIDAGVVTIAEVYDSMSNTIGFNLHQNFSPATGTKVRDNTDDGVGTAITETLSITIREVGMDAINLDITGLGAEFDGTAPNP